MNANRANRLDMCWPWIDQCHVVAPYCQVRAYIAADRTSTDKGNTFGNSDLSPRLSPPILLSSHTAHSYVRLLMKQHSRPPLDLWRCRRLCDDGLEEIPRRCLHHAEGPLGLFFFFF